ncbi:amidohydrolase family protein [Paenibacillus beijingensis]|uniref:Amidohydrolase-related domain-containing protein n=1 Tax=Paenibacillus beijingensis TaxID=1126833 RepID=A0A0D5NJT9_9BACL|nr:amidohydrolase family protein [Paenibacillus beijingensis]AJY75536.1 hypothetical protein VN24_14410 [Paenibacillus beijingensis]
MSTFKEEHDLIDMHHHFIPEEYVRALESRGITEGGGVPLARLDWSPDKSLQMMDANQIGTAFVSLSAPGVYFGDQAFADELARMCNDYAAGMIRDYPGRFGAFATLPLPGTEQALRELEFALDTLHMDGVALLTNYGGTYLGDSMFEDLLAELNRRKAVVFIHPEVSPTSKDIRIDFPGWLLEFVFDTTRAVTNLALSGALDRYPDIHFILSHMGGTVPFLAERLALGSCFKSKEVSIEGLKREREHIRGLLAGFYYDTALNASSYAFGSLLKFADAGHVLYGSDYIFAPEMLGAVYQEDLGDMKELSEQDKKGIFYENASGLFPRLATS